MRADACVQCYVRCDPVSADAFSSCGGISEFIGYNRKVSDAATAVSAQTDLVVSGLQVLSFCCEVAHGRLVYAYKVRRGRD